MSVLPWRLNLFLVCLLVHRVSPFTYLLFSSPSFYFFVERDRYDGELERAGRRMHELGNMANQAALEFQYLIRSSVWNDFQEFKAMGANDPAAVSDSRAELNRLAVHLKCDTDTPPRFSDLINPAPYDPEASQATERAVKAWKVVESFPMIVSNLFFRFFIS